MSAVIANGAFGGGFTGATRSGGRRIAATRSAVRPASPRLRITRRGRAVLAVLIAAPLAVGGVVVGLGQQAAAESAGTGHAHSAPFEYVSVEPGQSLWSIAQSVAPSADPREVVDAIVDLNQLPSAEVSVGQQIAIPAAYAH